MARHDYPNFGQYMPINYFKAFVAAAAYCWTDQKFWYIHKRDRPWDIFLPCLKEYNEHRKRLIHLIDLPWIDEANKQRQSVLNLENCWSPKHCRFKLLITMTAMSVVDTQRWHRHKTLALADAATCASSLITSVRQPDYDLCLCKFSDMVCIKLDKRKWNHHAQTSSRISRISAKWIVNHLFGFGIRMAKRVGIQRSGKFKLGARRRIRSL
jgi:hypothetical protein